MLCSTVLNSEKSCSVLANSSSLNFSSKTLSKSSLHRVSFHSVKPKFFYSENVSRFHFSSIWESVLVIFSDSPAESSGHSPANPASSISPLTDHFTALIPLSPPVSPVPPLAFASQVNSIPSIPLADLPIAPSLLPTHHMVARAKAGIFKSNIYMPVYPLHRLQQYLKLSPSSPGSKGKRAMVEEYEALITKKPGDLFLELQIWKQWAVIWFLG